MTKRVSVWRVLLASVMIVIALMTTACGGDDDSDSTSEPTAPPVPVDPGATVRLNELQVIGTHNSYHLEPAPALLAAIAQLRTDVALSMEVSQQPLTEQLSKLGIRQLELDVFYDPEGGRYSSRVGPGLLGEGSASGIPELDQPGFKVMHMQDIDFETTCLTLVLCLQQVEAWSDANPSHIPVLVLIEAKDTPLEDPIGAGFTIPLPIDAASLDALDAEIRSVVDEDDMLTPADLIRAYPTLETAILEGGWPTIAKLRGQLVFALHRREHREVYLEGHESLIGRVMFTDARPGEPDAAFIQLNDVLESDEEVRAAVGAGYLVRTRADINTLEARSGDKTRFVAALASGAQFISTDYPEPDPDFEHGYEVGLPNDVIARCNPISAPASCRDSDFVAP